MSQSTRLEPPLNSAAKLPRALPTAMRARLAWKPGGKSLTLSLRRSGLVGSRIRFFSFRGTTRVELGFQPLELAWHRSAGVVPMQSPINLHWHRFSLVLSRFGPAPQGNASQGQLPGAPGSIQGAAISPPSQAPMRERATGAIPPRAGNAHNAIESDFLRVIPPKPGDASVLPLQPVAWGPVAPLTAPGDSLRGEALPELSRADRQIQTHRPSARSAAPVPTAVRQPEFSASSSLVDALYDCAVSQAGLPALELRMLSAPSESTPVAPEAAAAGPERAPLMPSALATGFAPAAAVLSRADIDRVAEQVSKVLEQQSRLLRERRGSH